MILKNKDPFISCVQGADREGCRIISLQFEGHTNRLLPAEQGGCQSGSKGC
jgi:hypothetical protein